MKLTTEQKTLSAQLARVVGIVEKRNTIQILANVLLTADGDTLSIHATDLDIEATASASANIEQPGSTTVNAALLADIVKKMPSGALLSLESTDTDLVVKAGRSRFKLATLPAKDFPRIASPEYTATFDMQSVDLAALLGMSKFAMSTEETKYYLNGVYLHHADGHIRAVATDGHRLAHVDGPDVPMFPGVIVPRKTVAELTKGADVGPVTVSVSDTKIRFDFGAIVIVSKVVDGTFPAYERILPKNNGNTMTAKADALKAVVARVTTVADDRFNTVKLTLGHDGVVLSCRAATGEADDYADATYDGDDMSIGFNAKYFAEVISQIGSGTAVIKFGGAMDPIIVSEEGVDGVFWVMMPLRVA
jgi:DNA polymerase-3 subunit beta